MRLFNGEEINIKNKLHSNMTDSELDDAYNQTNHRLVIDQGRYPVDQLVYMFNEVGRMDENPDYQRGKKWGYDRKSKLIESLIMNIPIPPVYLFEKDYNKYDILDGKQRITSIVEFYNNEFELVGLDIWEGLNGKRYRDLTSTFKMALNRSFISSIVIMKESSNNTDNASLIRTIFERLNSGGIALTTQESRNAILSGPFNSMCKQLVDEELFRKIWNINQENQPIRIFGNSPNLDDFDTTIINYSEYPLRYFAYRQIEKMDGSLTSFLDDYLRIANNYSSELIFQMKDVYINTLSFANELLNDFPFRRKNSKNSKPNLIIYDSLMHALTCYLDRKEEILKKKDLFIDKYYSLVANEKLFNGKYSHKKIVTDRIAEFKRIIEECI